MKYENNRDERLEALISNTTKSNRWCVDFDPFGDHDAEVMKEWFVENERKKGNKNQFLKYYEGPGQTRSDSKDEKIRVNCMSYRDTTKISYPRNWADEGRVKTTLVAWTEDHHGAWEMIEDRTPIDSYINLKQRPRYMCVFVQ